MRLWADVLAESAASDCVVCPSHLHRPAASLRSAPSRACLSGSAWRAPANGSHDVSHHRTASESCSLGAMAYCRTHTSSSESYRERNRSCKYSERTNGTPGVLPFAFPAALRSLRSLPKHAHPNATHPARVPLTTYSPPALDQLDRSQSAPRKQPRPATSRPRNVNRSSTKRQPNINGTSTKRQRNVNRSSTKRQRNIK